MIQWSEMTYEQKLIYLRQELVRLKIFAQDVINGLKDTKGEPEERLNKAAPKT
jgi:hypothetical protein